MTAGRQPKPQGTPPQETQVDAKAQVSEVSALENFVRLQQHQEEYLKWLEASEKKPDVDRYAFKKVR